MKALIIENDYTVPKEITDFLKDFPNLFTHVNTQLFCKDRHIRDIARFIPDVDALIIVSTFLDKYQLENMTSKLHSGILGDKKIYIHTACYHLNRWLSADRWLFDNLEVFLAQVQSLVEKGLVFSFWKQWGVEKYAWEEVLYNKEHNVYHLPTEVPKDVREDIDRYK